MAVIRLLTAILFAMMTVIPFYPVPVQAQAVRVGTDTHLAHGWDFYTSHTECGGLRRDGTPQPPCKPKAATYEGAALGQCPAGSFLDIGTWQCWSCDTANGYERTAAAVDSDRACSRPSRKPASSPVERFKYAIKLGSLCPARDANFEAAFFDTIRGGECWACPRGYNTNVLPHVEAANKCTRPAHEETTPIRRHAKATGLIGTDCPSGQFWDASDGFCYSCPAGFNKQGTRSVTDPAACFRVVAAQDSKATVRGIGKCEGGAITDPRNNGECWRCPDGYDRVLLNGIDSPQACETTPQLEFARATFKAALTCPADQHFDFIAVDNNALNRLKGLGRTGKSAQAAPNGGTCWSCPADHKRTVKGVMEADACQGETTEWYAAPYPEPGLFGLDGASEVALEILRDDRAMVDETIREMVKACAESTEDPAAAADCRNNPQKEIADAWADIQDMPGESNVLMILLLGRIDLAATNAAASPGVRAVTAADRRLMNSFAAYVQKRRIYIAEEALKAYDAWTKATAYWEQFLRNRSTAGTVLQNSGPDLTQMKPTDEPVPAPDWHNTVLMASVASVSATTVLAGGMMAAARAHPGLRKAIFPKSNIRNQIKARMARQDLIKKSTGEVVEEVTEEVAKKAKQAVTKTAQKAVTLSTKGILKFLNAAGPAFVIGTVIEVIVEVATKLDEHSKTDRKHLDAMLAQAKLPVNLVREFQTEEGVERMDGYWLMAMSGISAPSPALAGQIKSYAALQPQAAVAAASQAMASTAGRSIDWEQVAGRAHDIAVASDGTVWVIGDNPVAGGRTVHYRGPAARDWAQVQGGAVRIAVAGTTPWLVNDAGGIFERRGNGWTQLQGPKARDIGASARGVWILAEPTNGQGEFSVYRRDGSSWTRAQGAAGMRIAVDAQGNPWVTTARGEIYALVNNKWERFLGSARDIAVDTFGAPVAVDMNGKVQVFDLATNKWIATNRDGAAIAIGAGKVWHLGPNTEVFRQK